MRWIALPVAFTLLACSSGTPPRSRPPIQSGSGSAVASAPETAPTASECEILLAHAIELDARGRGSGVAPPTDAEREQLRTKLRPYVDECQTLPRAGYDCAIAATTTPELAACQETPRSSTSNSSVAPGGMTPAAPRSP